MMASPAAIAEPAEEAGDSLFDFARDRAHDSI